MFCKLASCAVRTGLPAGFLLLFLVLPAASAPGQDQTEKPVTVSLTRLADGVYARIVNPDSDAVANAGAVVLEKGVLLFDTHFTPEAGRALLAGIHEFTTLPVIYIVNSHFHPDHTHGNQVFDHVRQILGSDAARHDMIDKDLPELNRMIGIARAQMDQFDRALGREQNPALQESLRAQLKARNDFLQRMSSLNVLPPVMTLEDTLDIVDAKREVRLLFLGRGHTDGDVVMFLPREKAAFLGDLFFNAALPNVQDAYLLDWMRTLEEALKLDAETFIPGHGPPGKRSDVERFLQYLRDLKAMVEPFVSRGDPVEKAVRELRLPPPYKHCSFSNFFPMNVQKMYTELKAQELAQPQPEASKNPEPMP